MKHKLTLIAGSQLIRFFAGTQAFGMVVLHAGWMLLALATWGDANDPDSAHSITAPIVRAFIWLGGVDNAGHGDANSIMRVWGKLSILVYLIDLAWRRVAGERRPRSLWKLALVSGAIAFAGWVLALWPTGPAWGEAWIIVLFAVLTALATGWSILVRRLGDLIIAGLEQRAAGPTEHPAKSPTHTG
jgi:hypothetical protein